MGTLNWFLFLGLVGLQATGSHPSSGNSQEERHSFQLKHVIHATFPPRSQLTVAASFGQKPVLHVSSVSDWLSSLSGSQDPALAQVHGAKSVFKTVIPRKEFIARQSDSSRQKSSQGKRADPFLKVQSWASHEHQASPLDSLKEIRTPDPKDPGTVLALGKMTFNAYIEPTDKSWKQIPGWDVVILTNIVFVIVWSLSQHWIGLPVWMAVNGNSGLRLYRSKRGNSSDCHQGNIAGNSCWKWANGH
jgi:hypothetical protein